MKKVRTSKIFHRFKVGFLKPFLFDFSLVLFNNCEKPIENKGILDQTNKFAVKSNEVNVISSTFLKESSSFVNKRAKVEAEIDTATKEIEKVT